MLIRTHSLRWHLLVLVLASTIPFLIFAAIMVTWLSANERAASERRLARASQELASSLDQEIDSSIRILRTLAVSPSLQERNFRKFHAEAKEVLKTQPGWITILVHTENGKTLLNASRTFSARLPPPADPESLRELFANGKATVGDLKRGIPDPTHEGQLGFAVRVPVMKKGKAVLALSAVLSVHSLQTLVDRPAVRQNDEWNRTISDRNGIIAARSRSPEKFVGQAGTESFIRTIQSQDRGIVPWTTLDGRRVFLSFTRAPLSNWTTAVSVPVETLQAPARYARWLVTAIGLGLLLTFGIASFLYSGHLARSIKATASGASVLAHGGVPEIKSSRVQEVEDLRESLVRAAELIRRNEKERDGLLKRTNAALAEAESANRAKSEFVANISHELRTPLGIILGSLDLLSASDLTDEEWISLRDRMRRNAEHLLMLIDQVLDLSKIEAGALQLESRVFSLKRLLSDLHDSLEPTAKSKGVDLAFKINTPLAESYSGDPLRIRQILMNIVGNAVKFTDTGSVTVIVATKKISPDGPKADGAIDVEFLIQDTGIGIAPDQQERLFRPFSQADNSITRRYGGTGLGLLVSKRFAQALGGDVELVESTTGGSTFRIKLRVQAAAEASPAPEITGINSSESVEGGPVQTRPLEGMRVLLVDDSIDNRFLIRRFLTAAGAEVFEATDGRAAIEHASKADDGYHCILMDIQMPVLDGNRATAELRKRGYRKPIIALTANAMKTDKELAMRSGYDDYLTKPIDKRRLIETLAGLDPARDRQPADAPT